MRRTRLLAAAVPGLVLAVAATGCSALGGKSPAAAQSGVTTLVMYSGQHEQTTDALVTAFEKQNPAIRISVRSNDEGTLAQQIQQEGSKSPADLFYAENSPALEVLQEKGLLAAAPAAALGAIPAKYDSPQGDWVGITARVTCMVVADSVPAAQTPTSALSLADPQWKGKLAFAGTETDLQPVITAIAAKYGTARAAAWLSGLKANAADHLLPDNETVSKDVDAGQVQIGIVDNYYWYRQAADDGGTGKAGSRIAYFANGDPGYVMSVSGIATLASSKHKDAAATFITFLASATAQKIIADSDSFEYPLLPGVAANSEMPALSTLHPGTVSINALGDGSTAISLLQQAQLL
ncbi:extracellular solute-binding protein [Actinospica sp.]|jgi:iron(III) transport system substrate-binding protein|uniref:extracellular solute-binding protein n=1 Tax=Actinospica sp. TaxID=1872142 RepID=UPI002C3AFC4B|nr:extracellular solute-binding protein [Actinospica sp.]HWG26366.1 extracellular solute-binding protein [Actinospica sp.]